MIGPGEWRGPVQVAQESGVQFSSVGAALADDGRGLVVWASRRPRFDLTGVDVAADGTIGERVLLSAPGDHAAAPLVGMAADGEAIVAWRTGHGARGVSVCTRPAAGGSCVVRRLSPPRRRAVLQALAVDPTGGAIVAWLQRTARGWRVAVAQREPGKAFGPPRLIGPPGAGEAQVALGAGSAAVAFSRQVGRRGSEIRIANWPRGESPRSTHRISPKSHVADSPRVAIAGHESAVVAWQRLYRRGRFGIAHARFRDCSERLCLAAIGRQDAENFGPVRRLGPRPTRNHQASTYSLVVDGALDRFVLAWVHSPADERSSTQIRAAQWRDGALTAPVAISDGRYSAFDPQVAAVGGRTVVIYREYSRPGVRDGLVVGTFADGDGLPFGALAGLSSPDLIQQSASRPRLARAPSGAARVVFTDYGFDNSGAGEVAIARLPAAAPVRTPPP